jgi:outer membrane lipoprotein-sorting protein
MLRTAIAAAALAVALPASGLAQKVDELVARNVAARGGEKAWRAVSTLRLTGQMEIGRGMKVPYVLEQKLPGKMRFEFVFNGQTAIQCTDGKAGWKVTPFRGRKAPEAMTRDELREAAGPADLYGPLFDYASRGHAVELLGREKIDGRDAFKLKVTLPGGAVRWVYLDAETALEVKVEAMRKQGRRERRVETFYRDWKPVDGLLVPRRYESRVEGSKQWHVLTVESVRVNPALPDARFTMAAAAPAGGGKTK